MKDRIKRVAEPSSQSWSRRRGIDRAFIVRRGGKRPYDMISQ